MGGHGDNVVEKYLELLAELVDGRSFQELDNFQDDGVSVVCECASGDMSGILIADRVAQHKDVQRMARLTVNGLELIGKCQGLPLQRVFPVHVDVTGPGGYDLNGLVVGLQKRANRG